MSPRPNKRQRSSSDASEPAANDEVPMEDTHNEAQAIDLSNPVPHDTLWYDDGNIVLATDAYLYRVHKSVLSKQSSMFRDMFQVVDNSEDDSDLKPDMEQYEGNPVVKMIDDVDEEVYIFLSTLYNRTSFLRALKPTELNILTSLSRMSAKYGISEIKYDLIEYLMQFYPHSLPAYERNSMTQKRILRAPQIDQDFHLLTIARLCDASILLPTLFYACATQPLPVILSSLEIIGQEDFETIITGRESMMKGSYEIAALALPHGKKCRSAECAALRTTLFSEHINFTTNIPPPFPLQVSSDGVLPADASGRTNLCKTCVKSYRDALKANRQCFWRDLPSIFNLGTWDELRQQTQASL